MATNYLKAQAGAWKSPTPNAEPAVRIAQSMVMLATFDSDEPSDEMIAKIKSVVDQSQFTADESL